MMNWALCCGVQPSLAYGFGYRSRVVCSKLVSVTAIARSSNVAAQFDACLLKRASIAKLVSWLHTCRISWHSTLRTAGVPHVCYMGHAISAKKPLITPYSSSLLRLCGVFLLANEYMQVWSCCGTYCGAWILVVELNKVKNGVNVQLAINLPCSRGSALCCAKT